MPEAAPDQPPVRESVVDYPGGLRTRIRWTGSGGGGALAAGAAEATTTGAPPVDLGGLVADDPEARCRAELSVTGPGGAWSVRLASTIYDEPTALHWDSEGLLVVRYGFHCYGFEARSGALRWIHRSASPIIGLFGSPRLPHVIVQAEIETFALEPDGAVAWRIGHSDVVAAAELVGGRLVLESYGGQRAVLDPRSGRRVAGS
ncbi:MAG TPA: hypothetical protein VNO86_10245 [Candidatus Binatia bacterium]|nr:hypothetical protein [Candidatus Binatia bacterium]